MQLQNVGDHNEAIFRFRGVLEQTIRRTLLTDAVFPKTVRGKKSVGCRLQIVNIDFAHERKVFQHFLDGSVQALRLGFV